MQQLPTFVLLGISSMFALSGCGSNNSVRCDHAQPQEFTVKITAAEDKTKRPRVDKETVVACFQDDIIFAGNVDDFSISFKHHSPFEKELKSSRGKAIGKVNVDPKGKAIKYKYDVVIPGYPVLDPNIIIRTR